MTGLVNGGQRWIDLMNWYNSEVFAWSDDEIRATEASTIEEALEEDSGNDEQWNEVSFQGNQVYDDEYIGGDADHGNQEINLEELQVCVQTNKNCFYDPNSNSSH